MMWPFWLTWFLLQLDNFDSVADVTILTRCADARGEVTISTHLVSSALGQFRLSDNFDSVADVSILTQWQFWLSWYSDNLDSVTILTRCAETRGEVTISTHMVSSALGQFRLSDNFDSVDQTTILTQFAKIGSRERGPRFIGTLGKTVAPTSHLTS